MKKLLIGLIVIILVLTGCNNNHKSITEAEDEDISKSEDENISDLELDKQISYELFEFLGFSEDENSISYLPLSDGKRTCFVRDKEGEEELFYASIPTKDAEDKEITIWLYHDGNDNIGRQKTVMEKLSKDIFQILARYEHLETADITHQNKERDDYGNIQSKRALSIVLERETLDKINWEEFNEDNFKKVADMYY